MALIIEDGSIVADADSYVSVTEARSYATARKLVLPADDSDVESLLINAVDYLESFRSRYQGFKVSSSQALQFPRSGVTIDSLELGSNFIPAILKQAQIRLAIVAHSGVDLMPTRKPGSFIKKEVVGPLDTEYSEKIAISISPEITAVDALLAPLFSNVGFFLKTVRI